MPAPSRKKMMDVIRAYAESRFPFDDPLPESDEAVWIRIATRSEDPTRPLPLILEIQTQLARECFSRWRFSPCEGPIFAYYEMARDDLMHRRHS